MIAGRKTKKGVKKLKSILAIGLFIVVSSTISHASVLQCPFLENSGNWDLLANGGFEIGNTSSWGNPFFGGKGTVQASSAFPYSDAYSASLLPTISFNGGGFALGQSVPVIGGTSYVLSGFFNTSLMTSGSVYLNLDDIEGDISVGSSILKLGNNNWQFSWGTITIPEYISNVNVRMVRDGLTVAGEESFIDEVALTPLAEFSPPSQVPVPGAVWLLGSGLAGLAGLRRKKKK